VTLHDHVDPPVTPTQLPFAWNSTQVTRLLHPKKQLHSCGLISATSAAPPDPIVGIEDHDLRQPGLSRRDLVQLAMQRRA
jgi:hypothetical protein